MRGSVKSDVLWGKPYRPNIVVSCVYETKPVHFIYNSIKIITWVEKKKIVLSKTKQNVPLKLPPFNKSNTYNVGMKVVDISYQLRLVYCM